MKQNLLWLMLGIIIGLLIAMMFCRHYAEKMPRFVQLHDERSNRIRRELDAEERLK